MRVRGNRSVASAAIAVCLGVTATCRASEWQGESGVDYRMSVERNPNYSAATPANRTMGLMRIFGTIAAESASQTVDVTADWSTRRYSGDAVLDRDEYGARVLASQEFERRRVSLSAGVSQDTIMVGEFENRHYQLVQKWRQSSTIAPRIRFDLASSLTASAGLGLSQVKHPSTQGSGLVDYRNVSTDGSLQAEVSERIQGGVSAYATHLSTYGLAGTSDDLGAQGQVVFSASEKNVVELSSGLHRLTNSGLGYADSNWGWLISARGAVETALGGFSAGVSRSVVPGGGGSLVQRDQVDGELRYSVSAAVAATMNSQAGRERSWTSGSSGLDRNFATIGIRLVREMSPKFSVSLGNEWSYYAFENSPSGVMRAALYCQLTYRPDSVRLKRSESKVF